MAENGGGDKLVYFLIGAGIGAITALLFAPKAGSELRAEIADATRRGIDQARETGHEVGVKANEFYHTGVDRASELAARSKETVSELASRSKEAVEDLTSRSKEAIERQRAQVAAALEAGKQGYREAKLSDKTSAAVEES
jgi:gas vesicle protein